LVDHLPCKGRENEACVLCAYIYTVRGNRVGCLAYSKLLKNIRVVDGKVVYQPEAKR